MHRSFEKLDKVEMTRQLMTFLMESAVHEYSPDKFRVTNVRDDVPTALNRCFELGILKTIEIAINNDDSYNETFDVTFELSKEAVNRLVMKRL